MRSITCRSASVYLRDLLSQTFGLSSARTFCSLPTRRLALVASFIPATMVGTSPIGAPDYGTATSLSRRTPMGTPSTLTTGSTITLSSAVCRRRRMRSKNWRKNDDAKNVMASAPGPMLVLLPHQVLPPPPPLLLVLLLLLLLQLLLITKGKPCSFYCRPSRLYRCIIFFPFQIV